MRIGCSTITFGPLATEDALERIHRLGFAVVDIAAVPGVFNHVEIIRRPVGEVERIAKLVHDRGFEVAGLQSVPWHPDAIDDPDELKRRCTMAADVAKAIGASAWIVDANRPDADGHAGRLKGLNRFKRTISMASELAEERGLRLGVEAPHRGTLAETLPQVVELLEAADIPNLGIDLDTSHMLNAEASTAEILDVLGKRVIHLALRDGYRGGAFCTPGDGDFDFAEFLSLLAAAGYSGDATLELEPTREDASADDRANEAVRARDYLLPLAAAAGLA